MAGVKSLGRRMREAGLLLGTLRRGRFRRGKGESRLRSALYEAVDLAARERFEAKRRGC